MNIEGIGYKAMYRISRIGLFNRAADLLGNTAQRMGINYALGATRAAAVLHTSMNIMEREQATKTLVGLIKGKEYFTFHPYSEKYEPPKGPLVGGMGVEKIGFNAAILMIRQQHFIGKRPDKVVSIIEKLQDPEFGLMLEIAKQMQKVFSKRDAYAKLQLGGKGISEDEERPITAKRPTRLDPDSPLIGMTIWAQDEQGKKETQGVSKDKK